jgi:hypothetical protein
MPARFEGPPWTWVGWSEAAQNAAALAGVTGNALISNWIKASGDTLEFKAIQGMGKPILNGYVIFGDVTDFIQAQFLGATVFGARSKYISHSIGTEVNTGPMNGWHEMRHCPVELPLNDPITFKAKESSSTNVECDCWALISFGSPIPLYERPQGVVRWGDGTHVGDYFHLHVTTSASGAAAWTTSTNDFDNNADSAVLNEEGTYKIVGMDVGGVASQKALLISTADSIIEPGCIGPVDVNEDWGKYHPNIFGAVPFIFQGEIPTFRIFNRDGTVTPVGHVDIIRTG